MQSGYIDRARAASCRDHAHEPILADYSGVTTLDLLEASKILQHCTFNSDRFSSTTKAVPYLVEALRRLISPLRIGVVEAETRRNRFETCSFPSGIVCTGFKRSHMHALYAV